MTAMPPMDRDAIVAAILAARTTTTLNTKTVVNRFAEVLEELQSRGGTAQLFADVYRKYKP